MKNERYAVLDIRSFELTFLIGSKGLNDTFVICDKKSEGYEGFSREGFFDEQSFCDAVSSVVTSVKKTYEGKIETVYVGTPAPFISLKTMGHTISFPKKRKLTAPDVDALFESGLSELASSGKCIRRSAMYFSTGESTNKYYSADGLYGAVASSLKGGLCYYFADEHFCELVKTTLVKLGIKQVEFLPDTLAQSMYLLPEKEREGYAFLLDIGFMTSSISVVYGNGIVHEESFSCGLASILVSLMENLGVEYEKAEEILRSANISGGSVSGDQLWTDDKGTAFAVSKINEVIKYGLDILCEQVQNFFAKYYQEKAAAVVMNNTLWITGEGTEGIAGVAEHISRRLNRMPKIVTPDLPYYDKASYSSRIALLAMATMQKPKKKGFRLFGGRK
ncbi:MAG: cell division FtsA domain-containing protein [Clostridia bacterium]|nr:cell division FtsA domain-containing protein [Clostridia bacterium]